MLTCREITELATDYAEGHLAEAQRSQFVTHIAGCHGCATWVRQLEATSTAMGILPEPELPAELQAALLDRFDAWAKARAAASAPASSRASWHVTGVPALAIAAVFGLLVSFARRHSSAPVDWVVAFGLAAVAVALVIFWRRVTLGFAAIAASSAILSAVVTGGRGPLDGAGGLECLVTVGGVAALAAGAAWVAMRRETSEILGSAMGTWGVAAALASVAALQVACGIRSSLAHLITFHVGGLLVVIGVAHLGNVLSASTARR